MRSAMCTATLRRRRLRTIVHSTGCCLVRREGQGQLAAQHLVCDDQPGAASSWQGGISRPECRAPHANPSELATVSRQSSPRPPCSPHLWQQQRLAERAGALGASAPLPGKIPRHRGKHLRGAAGRGCLLKRRDWAATGPGQGVGPCRGGEGAGHQQREPMPGEQAQGGHEQANQEQLVASQGAAAAPAC